MRGANWVKGRATMQLGVIILVTRPQALAHCLGPLTRQTYSHRDFEIILVMSENNDIRLPETDISITKIIENDLHLSVRRNRGVKQTRAEVIAFIDDDAIPPEDWLEVAKKSFSEYPCEGVSGPLFHYNEDEPFSRQLAGAATDSFFLEGFDERAKTPRKTPFYNIPLCNCFIKRSVWERVGGFNENMYYYMDDIEFFYIASRLRFSFYVVPALAVVHKGEPFPFPYLRKKTITRFHVGMNTVLFYEIFLAMPFIRLALGCYGFIVAICFFSQYRYLLIGVLVGVYFIIATMCSARYFQKHPMVFFLLPGVFMLTHLVNFLSFTCGIVFTLVTPWKYKSIVATKNERFQKCRD